CPASVGGVFKIQAPQGFSPSPDDGWGQGTLTGARFAPPRGPFAPYLICSYGDASQPTFVSGYITRELASNCAVGNSNWSWQGDSGAVCGAGLQTDPAGCPVNCRSAAAIPKTSSKTPRIRRQR